MSVLKSIELLQPGLYGMDIKERKEGGAVAYDVEFREFTLEEVAARLNRFHREDEEPFEAVAEVSDFNQHAYELFLQPAVQATSNGVGAKMMREFHPLRFQRWSFSDLNPWLGWLAPAAGVVKSNRQPVNAKNVLLDLEKAGSAAITASLDLYRAVRDATTEALFFLTYGSVFSMYIADKRTAEQQADAQVTDAPELPYVKDALAAIERGGYAEALARIICLLKPDGEPLQLAKLQLGQELIADYGDLLPTLPPDEWRRLRG